MVNMASVNASSSAGIVHHEICAGSEVVNIISVNEFFSAGKDRLMAEIAAFGNEFNSNWNNNCGQVAAAITDLAKELTDLAKELKELLYMCKWATGIGAAVAGLCGIRYTWRQWRN